MKRLFFWLLLLIPSFSFAQLSVSAIGGQNGYAALRAQYLFKASPWLYVTPKYSFYQDNDTVDMISRFGLRLDVLPTERTDFGVEGSFIPDSNGYTSYSVSADGRYYLIKNSKGPVSNLYTGVGGDFINHRQTVGFLDNNGFAINPYNINQTRAKIFAGADVKPFTVQAVFSKALTFSPEPTGNEIIWEDVPFITTVFKQFIDYSLGAYVTLPVQDVLTLYGGYSSYKFRAFPVTSQSAVAGATVNLGGINITGNIEFRDFDKPDRQVFYSLSSGLAF